MTLPDWPMVTYWQGVNVNDLDRPKLIEIIKELGRDLAMAHKMHNDTLDLWSVIQLRSPRRRT